MATLAEALATALAHHLAGRLDLAAEICRRILAAEPNHPDALHLLGATAHLSGQHEVAVDTISRAIRLRPSDARFHNTLGEAYRALHRNADAIASYGRAVELAPNYVAAYINLGNTLRTEGNVVNAIASYHRAVEVNPACTDAYINLGNAWKDLGKLDEAVGCYRRALELNPTMHQGHNNLGNALKDQGCIDDAIACFRTALALKPDLPLVHSNLLYALHFLADCDPHSLWQEHRRWNRVHASPLAMVVRPHSNDRDPDRRLRVGYLSPDFRWHPVGHFLLPLLESHDHQSVDIHCYSSVQAPDEITQRLRSSADTWRDVVALSDEQLAGQVRADGIDILVDLTMHMAGNRLLVFARKPAPVQVTYLAYCGTTGLDTIDYRLTDPFLDPPGQDAPFYSEQSFHLPETYWCYRPSIDTPAPNPLPANETNHVTFACLNNFCKASPSSLAAWCRLLGEVPRSRLLLHAHAGSHRDRLLALFARHGVSPDRLEFIALLPAAEYFRTYQRIDIALDPFPYGGGTTTCDALWMGVPVVTLVGQTAVGRGGLSILSNLGLPELAARDADQYVRIASDLARDLVRLAELRATLRERMQRSPLMDAPRFARNVESAYLAMWRRWCAKSGE